MKQAFPMRPYAVSSFILLTLLVLAGLGVSSNQEKTKMDVYKHPQCSCCGHWIDYVRANGFDVTIHDVPNTAPLKSQHGVPTNLHSCHTSLVDGYVVEGHVPVSDIQRLLRERPAVAGIAVPGMPGGSPGMDHKDKPAEPYDVLTFERDGRTQVFASHGK